jgi:hypothetical protein
MVEMTLWPVALHPGVIAVTGDALQTDQALVESD